jgi:drug/metabolite transporter (DMT)-like permease
MSDSGRPRWLYPVVLVGVLCFAVSAILVRYASDAPGLAIAALRTSIAVGLLAPAGIPALRRAWPYLSRRDLGLLALAGVLLGLHFAAWITSIYHTSVANAAVLVSTGPVFMALFGWLLLNERLSVRTVVAILVAVGGSALLGFGDTASSSPAGGDPLLGNALALVAAVLWALYLLIGRVVRQRIDWLPYIFPLYVVAAVTTTVFALGTGTPLSGYPAGIYLLAFAMAVFPQILGHGSFNYAVKYVPAAFLGLVSLLEPIGASALAMFLFQEFPGPVALAGMALILVAVGVTMTGSVLPSPETD